MRAAGATSMRPSADAREAVDRRDEPRPVGADEHVLADLDGRGARLADRHELAAHGGPGLARDGQALDREHRARRHGPEAAGLDRAELRGQRELAVLGLDRAGAPRDLLGEREPGEAAGHGVLAHAVHDAARREEGMHPLPRRARDTGCARRAGAGASARGSAADPRGGTVHPGGARPRGSPPSRRATARRRARCAAPRRAPTPRRTGRRGRCRAARPAAGRRSGRRRRPPSRAAARVHRHLQARRPRGRPRPQASRAVPSRLSRCPSRFIGPIGTHGGAS